MWIKNIRIIIIFESYSMRILILNYQMGFICCFKSDWNTHLHTYMQQVEKQAMKIHILNKAHSHEIVFENKGLC